MGLYVASERSIYRELKRAKLLTHRDRSQPRTHKKPLERVATGPKQAWAWDITYLPAAVMGTYYFLYAVLDAGEKTASRVAVPSPRRPMLIRPRPNATRRYFGLIAITPPGTSYAGKSRRAAG
jgi:transposase InsO family protein